MTPAPQPAANAEALDFPAQLQSGFITHTTANFFAKILKILCGCSSCIDHEICMQF